MVCGYSLLSCYMSNSRTLDKERYNKVLSKSEEFFWDEPYLFEYCANQIIRRCVIENEFQSAFRHEQACGGHLSVELQKFYNVVFIGLLFS